MQIQSSLIIKLIIEDEGCYKNSWNIRKSTSWILREKDWGSFCCHQFLLVSSNCLYFCTRKWIAQNNYLTKNIIVIVMMIIAIIIIQVIIILIIVINNKRRLYLHVSVYVCLRLCIYVFVRRSVCVRKGIVRRRS